MSQKPVKDDVKDPRIFFDNISDKYIRETFDGDCSTSSLGRAGRTNQVLRLLDKYLNAGATIADVGCGPGQFAKPLADRGHKYIGMDVNESMFADCASQFIKEERISFRFGRLEAIPLEDESVECVICIGVFEYIPDDLSALNELLRVLKKSGLAVITFPSIRYPLNRLRVLMRPVLAPTLRACVPRLKDTVYVSGIPHRILNPSEFITTAKACGFDLAHEMSDGYFSLFNHRERHYERSVQQWFAKWGSSLFPLHGSNYYVCLRKQ